jgi:hypothetical protein
MKTTLKYRLGHLNSILTSQFFSYMKMSLMEPSFIMSLSFIIIKTPWLTWSPQSRQRLHLKNRGEMKHALSSIIYYICLIKVFLY